MTDPSDFDVARRVMLLPVERVVPIAQSLSRQVERIGFEPVDQLSIAACIALDLERVPDGRRHGKWHR